MMPSNYKPNEKEKQFLKYHDTLMREIRYANFHFKLWKRLENCKVDYLEEFNQAPNFFGFTAKAHLDTSLMHIFKIIDKSERQDPLSIWKFLRFIDNNREEIFSTEASLRRIADSSHNTWHQDKIEELLGRHTPVTHQHIEEDYAKLDKLQQPINKLWEWRKKLYSHMDRKVLLRGVNIRKDYSLRIEEIEGVISTLAEILNKYLLAFNLSEWMIDIPGESGIQEVMESIRFKRRQERKSLGLDEN